MSVQLGTLVLEAGILEQRPRLVLLEPGLALGRHLQPGLGHQRPHPAEALLVLVHVLLQVEQRELGLVKQLLVLHLLGQLLGQPLLLLQGQVQVQLALCHSNNALPIHPMPVSQSVRRRMNIEVNIDVPGLLTGHGVVQGDGLGDGVPGPQPLHLLLDDPPQQRRVRPVHHVHRLAWPRTSIVYKKMSTKFDHKDH